MSLRRAVGQEIAAVRDTQSRSAPSLRAVGRAIPLPATRTPVTTVYSVDTRRRTLSPEQLVDAFLARAADDPPASRFSIEEVVLCAPAEVQVRVDAAAAEVSGLHLFVTSDPLKLLQRLERTLETLPDEGLATALCQRQLSTASVSAQQGPALLALNAAQQTAVAHSLGVGVNVVWGPPGTGKTSMLGVLLSSIVDAGKSVLLVSNTNVAVDGALLKVAGQHPEAAPGVLVRAGVPAAPEVCDHPHLRLERAVRNKAEKLVAQVETLDKQICEEADALTRALARSNGDASEAKLATFPPPEEVAAIRDRHRAQQVFDQAEMTVSRALDNVTTAEDRLVARELALQHANKVYAECVPSDNARTALAGLLAELTQLNQMHQRSMHQYDQAFKDRERAAGDLAATQCLGWWQRRKAVPSAQALLVEQENVVAEAERACAHTGAMITKWRDENDATLQHLRDVAGRYSAEYVKLSGNDVIVAQDRVEQVRSALDARWREARSAQERWRTLGDREGLSDEDEAILTRVQQENYDDLLADVAAARQLREGYTVRRTTLIEQRRRVLDEIGKLEPTVLETCQLLATTVASLTGTAALAPALTRTWDYVVIDEASACLMPHLLVASARAKVGVTIVGDFLQNGPASRSAQRNRPGPPVSAALTQDIFSFLGINRATVVAGHPGVTVLDTQYRFPALVADIANRFAYGTGMLKTGTGVRTRTFVGLPSAPVVLLDASTLPTDFRLVRSSSGKKAGAWLAGVAAALELTARVPEGVEFGIVTTYKEQENATRAGLDERGFAVECGTSHRYQGREFDLVLFDTTEPAGHRGWSSAARFTPNPAEWAYGGARLCNVALTRCRHQVGIVVDTEARVVPGSFLAELQHGARDGRIPVVDLADLLNVGPAATTTDEAVASWLSTDPTTIAGRPPAFLNEEQMYRRLPGLLAVTQRSVEIWSAFIAARRLRLVLPLLEECVRRGLQVTVHCKPPAEIRDQRTNTPDLIERIAAAGVRVECDFGTHEKALLLDGVEGFYGSLNLLSYSPSAISTSELMIQLSGEVQARAFRELVQNRSPRRGR
jgi:hypothetical protein